MNVLFVCKHNTFRSRIAEAYYKKLFPFNVSSGGIFPGTGLLDVQKKVIKKLGLELSKQKPITVYAILKSDVIVIVADDVPSSLFKDKRYGEKEIIVWDIPDLVAGCSESDVEEIISKIKKRAYAL